MCVCVCCVYVCIYVCVCVMLVLVMTVDEAQDISSTVESQHNRTHYGEHLSIVNATKAIVARAIVTKKKEAHLFKFFHIM